MKLVKAKQDYGIWCKQGRYHLISNSLAESMINKDIVKEVAEVSQDDIEMRMASFKINGVPECLVKWKC